MILNEQNLLQNTLYFDIMAGSIAENDKNYLLSVQNLKFAKLILYYQAIYIE